MFYALRLGAILQKWLLSVKALMWVETPAVFCGDAHVTLWGFVVGKCITSTTDFNKNPVERCIFGYIKLWNDHY